MEKAEPVPIFEGLANFPTLKNIEHGNRKAIYQEMVKAELVPIFESSQTYLPSKI